MVWFDSKIPSHYPDLLTVAIPLFAVGIIVEILVANWKKKKIYRLSDSITSLNHGSMDQLINIFVKTAMIFPYTYIYYNYHFPIGEVIERSIWGYLIVFVAYDFAYYWTHRFGHENNMGWAIHVTHHSSEDFNLITALRQASFQRFLTWPEFLPLALFFSPQFSTFHSHVNLIYQFWTHTGVVGKLPFWIEYIFNTPSHHRVHHGSNKRYLDKNYGGVFIIWDKMFGTFEPEGEEVVYGLTTPVASYNPIYTLLHQFYDLYKVVSKIPNISLGEKLYIYFIKGPGYVHPNTPTSKSTENTEEKLKPYSKYDPKIPLFNKIYAVFHWLTFFAIAYILTHPTFEEAPLDLKFWLTFYVIYGFLSTGLILENHKYASLVELSRLLMGFYFAPFLSKLLFCASVECPQASWSNNTLTTVSFGTLALSIVLVLVKVIFSFIPKARTPSKVTHAKQG
eukprot:TRINITY_DN2065_c0_g1_i1.p1 TRINITY_DN2065_c0_g1~~TRINITY_DN2065_c0_g1_i1.p1  ORF type:complete len:451 (+),score=71.13 TRINITY_DN2065_c0_g1_i1:381-1733(+)